MTHEEFRAVLDEIEEAQRLWRDSEALWRIKRIVKRARAKLDETAVENCR